MHCQVQCKYKLTLSVFFLWKPDISVYYTLHWYPFLFWIFLLCCFLEVEMVRKCTKKCRIWEEYTLSKSCRLIPQIFVTSLLVDVLTTPVIYLHYTQVFFFFGNNDIHVLSHSNDWHDKKTLMYIKMTEVQRRDSFIFLFFFL